MFSGKCAACVLHCVLWQALGTFPRLIDFAIVSFSSSFHLHVTVFFRTRSFLVVCRIQVSAECYKSNRPLHTAWSTVPLIVGKFSCSLSTSPFLVCVTIYNNHCLSRSTLSTENQWIVDYAADNTNVGSAVTVGRQALHSD